MLAETKADFSRNKDFLCLVEADSRRLFPVAGKTFGSLLRAQNGSTSFSEAAFQF
jgi:hypothetical protein